MPEYSSELPDSGHRVTTSTGALRERAPGKGRYDLITPIGLRRLALHYENGAKKYGERNWEKGMPIEWFLDSAIRHLYSYLAGDRSEDHLAAAAWNALGAIHMEELAAASAAQTVPSETQRATLSEAAKEPVLLHPEMGPDAESVPGNGRVLGAGEVRLNICRTCRKYMNHVCEAYGYCKDILDGSCPHYNKVAHSNPADCRYCTELTSCAHVDMNPTLFINCVEFRRVSQLKGLQIRKRLSLD